MNTITKVYGAIIDVAAKGRSVENAEALPYDSEGREIVSAQRLDNDAEAIIALHNSWPAIHRVLLAAREVAANEADDIDSRLRYVEVRPGRDEWRELVEALRALDGDKGAT